LRVVDWRGDGVPRELELSSSDAAVPLPPRFARLCVVGGACFAVGVRDAYELWRIDLAARVATRVALLPDWSQSAELSLTPDRRFAAVLTRAPGAPHDGDPVDAPGRMPRLAHTWQLRIFDYATGALLRDWNDLAVGAVVVASHEIPPVLAWKGSVVTLPVLRPSGAAANGSDASVIVAFVCRDAATGVEQPALPPAPEEPLTRTTGDGRFAVARSADDRVEVLDVQRNQRRVVAEGASAYWLLPTP
jgi:hypothetical protein